MLLAPASIRVLLLLTQAKSPGRGLLDPFDEADSFGKVDMDPLCGHAEAEGSSSQSGASLRVLMLLVPASIRVLLILAPARRLGQGLLDPSDETDKDKDPSSETDSFDEAEGSSSSSSTGANLRLLMLLAPAIIRLLLLLAPARSSGQGLLVPFDEPDIDPFDKIEKDPFDEAEGSVPGLNHPCFLGFFKLASVFCRLSSSITPCIFLAVPAAAKAAPVYNEKGHMLI